MEIRPWDCLIDLKWRGKLLHGLVSEAVTGACIVDLNCGQMPVAQARWYDPFWGLYLANDLQQPMWNWATLPGLSFRQCSDLEFAKGLFQVGETRHIDIALFLGSTVCIEPRHPLESATEYEAQELILQCAPRIILFECWKEERVLRGFEKRLVEFLERGYKKTVDLMVAENGGASHGERRIVRLDVKRLENGNGIGHEKAVEGQGSNGRKEVLLARCRRDTGILSTSTIA